MRQAEKIGDCRVDRDISVLDSTPHRVDLAIKKALDLNFGITGRRRLIGEARPQYDDLLRATNVKCDGR